MSRSSSSAPTMRSQERTIADVDDDLRAIVTQLQGADIEVLLTGAFGFYPRARRRHRLRQRKSCAPTFEALFPTIADDLDVELLRDTEGSDKFLGGERIAARRRPTIPSAAACSTAIRTWQIRRSPAAPTVCTRMPPASIYIVERVVPQTVELGAAAGVVNDALELANGSIELLVHAGQRRRNADAVLQERAGRPSLGDIEIQLDGDEVAVGMQTASTTFGGRRRYRHRRARPPTSSSSSAPVGWSCTWTARW